MGVGSGRECTRISSGWAPLTIPYVAASRHHGSSTKAKTVEDESHETILMAPVDGDVARAGEEARPMWEELSDEGYDRFIHGMF